MSRWPERTVSERFWSKVERGEHDACWPWTAGSTGSGYGDFWDGTQMQKAHRVAYELSKGPIPAGMVIDHRCFNRGCVNPAHLRVVTRKQNNENHQGARRDSKSGVRGVYPKSNGRWCAEVRHEGKRVHVGYFDAIRDAEAAVLAMRRNLHSHNDRDRATRGV